MLTIYERTEVEMYDDLQRSMLGWVACGIRLCSHRFLFKLLSYGWTAASTSALVIYGFIY